VTENTKKQHDLGRKMKNKIKCKKTDSRKKNEEK
jgi:hypothetical protein